MASTNINPFPAGMENVPDVSNMAVLIRNIAVSIRTFETQTDEVLLNKNMYGKTVETQTEEDMLLRKSFCNVAMQTDNFLEWRKKSNDNTEVLIGQFLHDDSRLRVGDEYIQDGNFVNDSNDGVDDSCFNDSFKNILDKNSTKFEIEIVNDDVENMVSNDPGDGNELQSEQQSNNLTCIQTSNQDYGNRIGGVVWSKHPSYINSASDQNGLESSHRLGNHTDIGKSTVQDETLELIQKKLTVQSNNTKKHQTHVLEFSNKPTKSTVDQSSLEPSSVWQQIVHVGREEEIQMDGNEKDTTNPLASKVVPLDKGNTIKQQTGGSKKQTLKNRSKGYLNFQKVGQKSKTDTEGGNTTILDKQNGGFCENSYKKKLDHSLNTSDDPDKNPIKEKSTETQAGEEIFTLPGSLNRELVLPLRSILSKTEQFKDSIDAVSECSEPLAENNFEMDHSYSLSDKNALQNNNVYDQIYSSEDDINDGYGQESETEQIISPTKTLNNKKITVINKKQAKYMSEKQKSSRKNTENVSLNFVDPSVKIKDCFIALSRIEQETLKDNAVTVSEYFVESQNETQVFTLSTKPSEDQSPSKCDSKNVIQNSINHPHRTRSKIKLVKAEYLEKHKAQRLTSKRKQKDGVENLNKKKVQTDQKNVEKVSSDRVKTNVKKGVLACALCAKYVASDYKMMIHMRKHERKKIFKCQICSQKFSCRKRFNGHVAHHNQKQNYECAICRRLCFNQSALNLHMVSHSNVFLSCPHCAKVCKGKNGLHLHLVQYHYMQDMVSVEDKEESQFGKKKYSTRIKTGTINIINYKDKLNLDISVKKSKGLKIGALKHAEDLNTENLVGVDIENNVDDGLQQTTEDVLELETLRLTQNAKSPPTFVQKELHVNETVTENIETQISKMTNKLFTGPDEMESKCGTIQNEVSGQIVDEKEDNISDFIQEQNKEKSQSNEIKNSISDSKKASIGKDEHFVTGNLEGDIEPKCEGCGEIFHNVDLLVNHLNKNKNANIMHTCEKCQKVFPQKRNLQRHKNRCLHKLNKPRLLHKCEKCQKDFPRNSNLTRHQRICLGRDVKPRPRPKKYVEDGETPCPACGKILKSRLRMKIHYRNIHSGKPRPDRSRKCQLCGLVLAKQSNLNEHMKIHRGIKNYLCSVCGRKFRSKSSLTKHILVHKGEKKIKNYPCPICSKTFSTQYNRKIHQMNHTGEKPFKCNACGQQFRTNAFLNTHRRNVHHEAIPNSNLDPINYYNYVSKSRQQGSDVMSIDGQSPTGDDFVSLENAASKVNNLESLDVLKDNQVVALVTDGTKDDQLVPLEDGSKYNNLVSLVDNLSTEHRQVGIGDDGSIYRYIALENPHSTNETNIVQLEDRSFTFQEETECAVVTIMADNNL